MSVKRSTKYNYESLANAIIKQAFEDYVYALKPVAPGFDQHSKRDYKAHLRDDCESFFRGGWYDTLTALPPEILTRAAIMEKRKGQVYDWLGVLNRAKMSRFKARRKIGFQFKKCTTAKDKNKIHDKRHIEYIERVQRRKRRLKYGMVSNNRK